MAYKNVQLHGALLEEAVLYMLKSSGYEPVMKPDGDYTLQNGSAGLELRGRGAWHQIDTIADFKIIPPFSNPQRLLIEAKFYSNSNKVKLPVIRNAVGVVKDVSENWTVEPSQRKFIPKKRYHYLYAIFSASEFTDPAQNYAYAHDIYLLPLRNSQFYAPVISAINNVDAESLSNQPPIHVVRSYIRSKLGYGADVTDNIPNELVAQLNEVINACRTHGFGFIAMFGGQFPVFLIASREFRPATYSEIITVRIRWQDEKWFIEDVNEKRLFSFDLPKEIFSLYEAHGKLSRQSVANIKENIMKDFYAFHREGNAFRLLHFSLDEIWFEAIKKNLNK